MRRLAGVPPALVGREVSVRAVIPIWEGVRARGLDPERLAAGTGYSMKQLTTATERIGWDGFVRLAHNLGTLLTDDEIVALGSAGIDSPFLRAVLLPARMLFGLEDVVRWTFGASGPAAQLIVVHEGTIVPLGPGHMRLEVRVRPGYRPSRVNYLLIVGAIHGLARSARQPVSVREIPREDGIDLEIRVPVATGLLGRARRALSRISDNQLARMNAELSARYADLERETAARLDTELQLRRSEQRYRDLFESAPLPMWVFDVATLRFLAVNRAAVRVYGYTDEDFAAMKIEDIRPTEDLGALREYIAGSHDDTRMWRHRKKDGSMMDVQISVRDLTFEGRPARLVHVLDMTERLALERQLRQVQKLEAVGQLAGGIAHDFNNLLMVITSYTDLMLRERDSADLRAIRIAADRGAELTQKLLAFAGRTVIEPCVLDLGEIVEDMRVLLQPIFEKTHLLVYDIAPAHGRVHADRGGIEQIVMNLAVNARDAMPDGGTLKVIVRDIEIDEDFAGANVGLAAGPHVALVVCDTGIGMDEHTQSRMFEPFFTTKEVGKGTGLGLSTVLGIVQQNGGHIHIDSEPRLGTTVAVYFPRV